MSEQSEHQPPPSQPWLEYARADLDAARELRQAAGMSLAIVCFHAQQAAEKALKAVLIHHGINFPRTHIIERLLDLLIAAKVSVPENVDEAFVLTDYAVETRYPGINEPVTLEEAD